MAIPKTLKASCSVIVNEQNQILVMKRADNGLYGLPGGGLELGETFEDCAVRETLEETGALCRVIRELYRRIEDNGVECVTFLCVILDDKNLFDGSHKHEGKISWEDPKVLVDKGAYPQYNREVIDELNKIMNR